MAYEGITAKIPLGNLGLLTDDDPAKTLVGGLIRAQNVQLRKNFAEKEPGSRRYTNAALPSGITGLQDWWPNDTIQRVIAVTRSGLTYQIDHNGYKQTLITGTPTNLNTGQPYFILGGAEALASNRKVFICTGSNQVQVIDGDSTVRRAINHPAADWVSSKYPTHGVVYGGRLWLVSGNNLYASSISDHEDFTTVGAYLLFNVFPGDAEKIQGLSVWKSRLYILKYPRGLFYLDDTDPTTTNWAVRKLSNAFGGGQIRCMVPALDDLLVANETGSITSMHAVQAQGGVDTADILNKLRCEDFMRQTTRNSDDRQCIYYADRKQVLFSYRSIGGTQLDRLMKIDLNRLAEQGSVSDIGESRVTWSDKDQANCLALMKDENRIERPIYGAEDGYVYLMDVVDRSVAGTAYTFDLQTGYLDMSHLDPKLADVNKNFDFLQVTFAPTGDFTLSVDIFIDDRYTETISFKAAQIGSFLLGDSGNHLATDFTLGDSGTPTNSDGWTEGEVAFPNIRPLHGNGKRISLRCYNAGLRETIRISALTVFFRPAGHEAEKE